MPPVLVPRLPWALAAAQLDPLDSRRSVPVVLTTVVALGAEDALWEDPGCDASDNVDAASTLLVSLLGSLPWARLSMHTAECRARKAAWWW